MKITLWSITVTIALLMEVRADVQPQKNFDLKRFAGRWYRVGLAYNSPGFTRHRNKLTICMGVVEPKENGDVQMTVWKSKLSICQKEVYKYEKTSVPGVFTYFSTRPGFQELKLDTSRNTGFVGSDEDLGEPMFRILLDVIQFKPEDILIQVFEGWLMVRGQHGARMDEHGFVSRSFTRQYQLPDLKMQAGDLTAMLCHDGILVVETKERWWAASD